MDPTINVMIIEDNKAFTKSLRDIIELTKGMECLNHFHSAEAGLEALKDPAAPHPDILLLDLNLPGEDGLTMLPILKKESPKTDVIILTQNNDYHTVLQAIHLGAGGYLLKGGTIAAIRETIREVHGGSTFIDPQLSRMVLNTLCHGNAAADNPLSPREVEVLELLAQGFSKKEAADMLNLSEHTVSSYVRTIFEKLEAPNTAAAIATAIRQRLI
jgi:DNA-binding NarL/FixJ family response regulator